MFLVGGGILTHGVPAASHAIKAFGESAIDIPIPAADALLGALVPMLLNAVAGVAAGAPGAAAGAGAAAFAMRSDLPTSCYFEREQASCSPT